MTVSQITNFSIEKFFQTSKVVVCEAICEIHFEGPIWVAEPTMSKESWEDTRFLHFFLPTTVIKFDWPKLLSNLTVQVSVKSVWGNRQFFIL